METPPTPAAPEPCPDCRGSGKITLLLSIKPCKRCRGTGRVDPLLDRALDDLELSIRARAVLARLGVRNLRQAMSLTQDILLRAPGSNALVVREVASILARLGLTLGGKGT